MRLLKDLYISEDLHRQAPQITEDLKNHTYHANVYLLTCDLSRNGQLELIHIQLLRQKTLAERLPLVIGIASSKEAGIEMIGAITAAVLEQYGSVNYAAYFEAMEQITSRG